MSTDLLQAVHNPVFTRPFLPVRLRASSSASGQFLCGTGSDFDIHKSKTSLNVSPGDEVFENSFQMGEEDCGMAFGEKKTGAEPHCRISTCARIHTCNDVVSKLSKCCARVRKLGLCTKMIVLYC